MFVLNFIGSIYPFAHNLRIRLFLNQLLLFLLSSNLMLTIKSIQKELRVHQSLQKGPI